MRRPESNVASSNMPCACVYYEKGTEGVRRELEHLQESDSSIRESSSKEAEKKKETMKASDKLN